MEKENKKKKNYWKVGLLIGIGVATIACMIDSHNSRKKLNIIRGENQNLHLENKSLIRQIKDLAYQNGKLTTKIKRRI